MDQNLIIVGASTRAAAQSALRAGYRPWLADMFGDVDLQACGPVQRIDPYPWALVEIMTKAPHAPWMYTGALENYPGLIDSLATVRPLWGNQGNVVRSVRSPAMFAAAIRAAGFSTPCIQPGPTAPDRNSAWIYKSEQSAGGRNIAIVDDGFQTSHLANSGGVYFQERILGRPVSAVYVASQSRAKLLGMTMQLIGDDDSYGKGNVKHRRSHWCTNAWTGAQGFWYAGSIGPLTEPEWMLIQAAEIGQRVADAFGLVGIFGVDAIQSDETLWPLEVNPRYTASVEVLERSLGFSAIELHARACAAGSGAVVSHHGRQLGNNEISGKAILYARQDFQVPYEFPAWASNFNNDASWPQVADIPHATIACPAGSPICTVFAKGSKLDEARDNLEAQAKMTAAALNTLCNQRTDFTATPESQCP